MKLSFKVFAVLIVFFGQVLASDFDVVRVKTLGLMKHRVIFQDLSLKRIKGQDLYSGKIVARWGTQVYEVVDGIYDCSATKKCRLVDYESIATFESCKVLSKKVVCHSPISGDDEFSPGHNDSAVSVVYGAVDEFPARDRTSDRDYDGDQRSHNEFDDLF